MSRKIKHYNLEFFKLPEKQTLGKRQPFDLKYKSMKKQVFNPYLPLYEYTPDCEPHVFGDRLYVYGSHDRYGAFPFCHNNYVTYSTPINDLSDWRFEGEIFDKKEDPHNRKGKKDLYAPDVTQGKDGKFYLYYSLAWGGTIGVAVSNRPTGPFHYLGDVKYSNGETLGRKKGDTFQFDPAIFIDDDGRIYLYSGFGAISFFPQIQHGLKPMGGFVMELEDDMLTIKKGPIKLFSKANDKINLNRASKEHSFFEASSLRKINGTYYFIYSSLNGDELCYMTSSSPMGPFQYRGVIISNGDVGLNGRKRDEAVTPIGNNHGSIVSIKDKFYIFYHRHTNYTNTDRQDCAEEIHIDKEGNIAQVEITSCGLNGGPLIGKGSYPASICCYYKGKRKNVFYPFFALPFQKRRLRIHQDGKDEDRNPQYVQNIRDGALIGYKYFDLSHTSRVFLNLKGKFKGKISIRFEEKGKDLYSVDVNTKGKERICISFSSQEKKKALYFHFEGKGRLDFYSFILE